MAPTSSQEMPVSRLQVQVKQARAHAEQKKGEATSLEAEAQQAKARAEELEEEARRARCFPFRLSLAPRNSSKQVQLLKQDMPPAAQRCRLPLYALATRWRMLGAQRRVLRASLACAESMHGARQGISRRSGGRPKRPRSRRSCCSRTCSARCMAARCNRLAALHTPGKNCLTS